MKTNGSEKKVGLIINCSLLCISANLGRQKLKFDYHLPRDSNAFAQIRFFGTNLATTTLILSQTVFVKGMSFSNSENFSKYIESVIYWVHKREQL